MKIESIRTLAGPNVFSYRPVVVMRLDLDELYERESCEFDGFNDRLLALLPNLQTHHCALGRPGGFVTRLEEGTYFGHIVEHVALELTDLIGVGATHGKTRHDEGRVYNVAIEYKAERAATYLLEQAVSLVDALYHNRSFAVTPVLEHAKQLVADWEPGPTTRAIMDVAERRGIPCRRDGLANRVQLGYGKHLRYVQAAMTDNTNAIAVELAQDKDETKERLHRHGIPVPKGVVVRSLAEAKQAAETLQKPIVVKPLTGHQGHGVSLEVATDEEMKVAFEAAREFSSTVLVEEMFPGRNYRVVVIAGIMVAASERLPSTVTGDGVNSIRQLIEIENRNPLRGDGHERPLTKIKVDADVLAHLAHNRMSLESVPVADERVTLSNRTNLSTGATACDVTDRVHPSVAGLCERVARLIGLDVCGVDLVIPDIAFPITSGGVIEVNASPGLRMHHFPSQGQPRDVGQALVDSLYPHGAPSRIPIISITGTNGKTTVTRMIGHVLSKTGLCVGMTTTDGIYIDGECVVEGDTTGPQSAAVVLSDPAVDAAVLETARGGIVRRGLGYDWSDIGVLTNIGDDHIGQDGIKSIDDVVFIKSLVAERVGEGGTLILNADNEQLVKLAASERVNKVPKTVVYFSLKEQNPVIQDHLGAGGTAYFANKRALIEAKGDTRRTIAELEMLPVVMNCAADFQVANLLATVAACRAYGVSQDVLLKSLIGFSSFANNPGRANLYRLNGGHVMVDYGHNSDAFDAICRMASKWKDRQVTGIIGVPGDRDDSVIVHAARVAAKGFNKVIVREDRDRRGRQRGAIANLLCDTVREVSPSIHCEVVLDEVEALRRAVSEMSKGEVIVLFYEKLLPIQKALEEFAAQPVPSLPPLPVAQAPAKVRSRFKRSFPTRSAVLRPRRVGREPIPASPPA
ncbi:MAG TPA: cyanophycin synthetase [Pyrinomonadaceae bacterium]|nr:cyanophycin synthetase [Pyrinomonadaceae bacterium]